MSSQNITYWIDKPPEEVLPVIEKVKSTTQLCNVCESKPYKSGSWITISYTDMYKSQNRNHEKMKEVEGMILGFLLPVEVHIVRRE